MFWCRVKAVHHISKRGIDEYETRDVFALDTLFKLKNTWESSLARAYREVESPYEHGALIVFEVEERGPRGVVYEPQRFVGLFDKTARDSMISRPSPIGLGSSLRVAGVTTTGKPVDEQYNAGWCLPGGVLRVMCDAPGANGYEKLIAAANGVWRKSVADFRRSA